jgi:protein SCO1/2
MLAALVLMVAVLAGTAPIQAHEVAHEERLSTIGTAPDFALTSQDNEPVTLRDFRGKVLAVAFIYTSCDDVCPLLTDKMAGVQERLGQDFGTEVVFLSITVDPEHDTPAVLKEYAQALDADVAGWRFLTGEPAIVREVARRYGVAVVKSADAQVDHNLQTTLIDRRGIMRVHYLGFRFDPEEFRRDLQSLLREP